MNKLIVDFLMQPSIMIILITLVVLIIIWYFQKKKLFNNTVFGLTAMILTAVEQRIPDDSPDKKWQIIDGVLKGITEEMANQSSVLSSSDIFTLIEKYVSKAIKDADKKKL